MRSRSLLVVALLLAPAAAVRADLPNLNTTWFRPATGGDGLAATEGARPLRAADAPFELKLWGVGEKDPIATGTAAVYNRFIGWAAMQLRVTDSASLFLQLPGTFSQHGELGGGYPFFRRGPPVTGPGDPVIGFRAALLRQQDFGLNLVLKATAIVPLGEANSLAADRTGRMGVEGLAAVSHVFGNVDTRFFELLANLFVRNHDKTDAGLGKFGSTELGVRVGAAFYPGQTLFRRVFAELDGQSSFRDFFADANTPMVARGGVTLCLTKNVSLDAVVGKGLKSDAIGSPDVQFVGAFGWSPSTCQPSNAGEAAQKAAAEKAAAEKAAAEKVAADKAAAEKAAADKIAADKAAAEQAEAERVAAEKAAADKAAADAKAAADKAAAEAQAAVVKDAEDLLATVQYASGKAAIEKPSFAALDQVASLMKAHPEVQKLPVQGRTGDMTAPDKNSKLSLARAKAVAAYLAKQGVEKERLELPSGK